MDGDGGSALLAMTAGPIMGHRSAGEEVLASVGEHLTPTGPAGQMHFSPREFADDQNSPRLVGPEDPTTYADLVDGVCSEHARTLADLLLRRTGVVWTGRIDEGVVERAADAVAREFGWTERERSDAVSAFLAEYARRYGVPASSASAQPLTS